MPLALWGCGHVGTRPASPKQDLLHQNNLLSLVLASALWSRPWNRFATVLVWQPAVVPGLSFCTAHVPQLKHLLRCIFFVQAHFGLELGPQHLPGLENLATDALSHNRIELFHYLTPQATCRVSHSNPASLLNMLLKYSISSTSPL